MQDKGKRIRTSDVTIKTAAIEIKAMTISKRQVTQSVFRQLLHEQVVDEETLQLKGPVWGRVNYFWGDDAKRTDDALHVVWQKGDELRRAIVPESLYAFAAWQEERYACHLHFRDLVHLGIADGHIQGDLQDRYQAEVEGQHLTYQIARYPYTRNMADDRERTAIENLIRCRGIDADWARERHASSREFLVSRKSSDAVTYDDTRNVVTMAAKILTDAEARWTELRASLEQTDHLFIAA